MGFFSWKTQDTNESIANIHSCKMPLSVVMTDNKGNQWVEDGYDGYGVFDGKDYYELVYEMNQESPIVKELLPKGKSPRTIGISIALGIRGIRHKVSGKQFLSSDIDFFNWGEPIFEGKSPNELLESGEWINIKYEDTTAVFPNLTTTKDWDWIPTQPENCEFQGYFY